MRGGRGSCVLMRWIVCEDEEGTDGGKKGTGYQENYEFYDYGGFGSNTNKEGIDTAEGTTENENTANV